MRPLAVALAVSFARDRGGLCRRHPGRRRTGGGGDAHLHDEPEPAPRPRPHTAPRPATLVAARGDLRLTYGALFSQVRGGGEPTAATVSWQVLTVDGTVGAGRLDGLFDGGDRESATGVPVFEARSGAVRLEPAGRRAVPAFAAHDPVLALAPAPAAR